MNIKKLAEQAKLDWDLGWPIYADRPNRFEIFAKLVAAHEREECADFAQRRVLATENNDQKIGYYHACRVIAEGIRARGKA